MGIGAEGGCSAASDSAGEEDFLSLCSETHSDVHLIAYRRIEKKRLRLLVSSQ